MGSKPLADRKLFLRQYKSKASPLFLYNSSNLPLQPEKLFPIPLYKLNPKEILLGTHPIYGKTNKTQYPNIHQHTQTDVIDLYSNISTIDELVKGTTKPINVPFDHLNFLVK